MIQITNIVKNYTSGDSIVKALKGISINFRENEFVSILGQSGCGKTTLLNVLGGLDKYDEGNIKINGKSTRDFKDKDWDAYRNHYIGFIFQSYNLIPHLTVLENVEIALSIAGISRKEKREKALNALKKVGLIEQIKKKPNQLSGGQMQRVAIARAIVNNPKIILADEPTGALDSETSVQIMDILKDIAKEHLIIMVTHNQELAKTYSTRIISLLDGKVIGDTNPYLIDEAKLNTISQKAQINDTKTGKKVKKAKTSMGFLTAIHLSLKNLLTKKGRTFMTSFAGSIGIIGIALILAISNGFTGYINKIQSDTLSGYPITISTFTVDTNSIQDAMSGTTNNTEETTSINENEIQISDPLITDYAKFAKYNYISSEFVEYIKEFEAKDNERQEISKALNQVQYSYSSPLNILTINNGEVVKVNTSVQTNPLLGSDSSAFYEGLENDEFVKSQYDVIYGTYPTNMNEVALVISDNNSITKSVATALGLDVTMNDKGQYNTIKFEDIVGQNGKEFKVILHDDYYTPIYDGETITEFKELNLTDSSLSSSDKMEIYNNSNNITLKISGILRIKEDMPIEIYGSGIVYSPKLTKYLNEINKSSEIVEETKNTGKFFKEYVINISVGSVNNSYTCKNYQEAIILVKQLFNYDLTKNQAIEYGLQNLGCSTIPTSIKIYPKNFDGKDEITEYINNWNNSPNNVNNQIIITDATKFLSDTMGQMVNIISYVLIAFAGISLVVSSIMISIITYVSVIERTKEIGVLRSIGARKKDITRVFNAETLLIGLCSGLLGVFVSWILTFPISAIIIAVAGGAITTQMAVLPPVGAIILVLISVLLTLTAGFIPAKIASKKDPVKALRTE